MKKQLLTAILVASAASVFGQGAINWGNNVSGSRFPIYGPDPGNPTLIVAGQSSLGTPTGSTTYGGALLQGTGFTFAFFAAANGVASNNMTLVASTTFRTTTGTGLPGGLVSGGTVTVPGAAVNNQGEYQVRVWNNQGGTINDWNSAYTAWQNGLIAAGVSPILTSGPMGGSLTDGTPIANPSSAGTSFNIYMVPEPTTFALAGLGAAALLIFRRRK